MKIVGPQKYDYRYFHGLGCPVNFETKLKLSDFDDVYEKFGDFLALKSSDTIVDLGCGMGPLSFYIFLRYKCYVIGIDYSKDAISMANANKSKFMKFNKEFEDDKIKFLNKDNTSLPYLTNVKAVYLKDVIEHLTDKEIDLVLNKIKKWNKEIYIILRTDNNIYKKYFHPFIFILVNLPAIIRGKISLEELRRQKRYDEERHINLTTARKLKEKLSQRKFSVEKVEYSNLTVDRIMEQLGSHKRFSWFAYPIYLFLKIFPFFRPSLFLVAKYIER